MQDSYYYKLRSIEADLRWIAKVIKDTPVEVFHNEERKKLLKGLIASIGQSATVINRSLGDELVREFPDVEV